MKLTKQAAQKALIHGVEMGVTALAAEITARGFSGALYGPDGAFQVEDLLTPIALFLAAVWRGAKLFLEIPEWSGEERRGDSEPPDAKKEG